MFVINDRLKKNFLTLSMVAAAVTIPLFNNLNSILTIIFVFAAALQTPVRDSLQRLRKNKFWMVPFVYFLWLICTWFWDTSGGFTIKQVERYAGLAFIPLGMAIAPPFSRRQLKTTCLAFSVATILICLICLLKSYLEYQQTRDYRVFYYHYLSEQMHLNAIFLSNYCLASIFWLLYFGLILRNSLAIALRILIVCAVIFLAFLILLLSSKMVIVLGVVAIIFSLIYFGYQKGYLVASITATVLIILGGFFAVRNLSYLKYRLSVTELKEYQGQADDQNGLAIRLLMWKSGLHLIRERPLLGYGLKGGREATLIEYKKRGYEMGYVRKWHTHNQYIETTLMSGIPGLVLLLTIIGVILIAALRTGSYLLLLGILHFAFHAMIEAVFEVQQELIFFTFFLFLFYFHQPGRTIKTTRTDG